MQRVPQDARQTSSWRHVREAKRNVSKHGMPAHKTFFQLHKQNDNGEGRLGHMASLITLLLHHIDILMKNPRESSSIMSASCIQDVHCRGLQCTHSHAALWLKMP